MDQKRQGFVRIGAYIVLVVGSIWAASAVRAGQWTEEDFSRKQDVVPVYPVVSGTELDTARSVIGSTRFYYAQKGDTFLDVARYYSLGYNEIEQANPGVDPWIPPEDKPITLPTEWVLPRVPLSGVVVNIPEMRLYYFHRDAKNGSLSVSTYPVGLGRDEWRTPEGKFKIQGKTKNPTWNIPESIRAERIREKGRYETMIPGGDPDNPLGKYRFELSLSMYRIHGTNIPWGVGMQVSHGCIRLYPEDIEQLFPMVPVGTPGEFVYQPVKIGAREGRIYAEAHPDIYTLVPGLFSEARRIVRDLGWDQHVDYDRLEQVVHERSGVPVDVTGGAAAPEIFEDDFRSRPVGAAVKRSVSRG